MFAGKQHGDASEREIFLNLTPMIDILTCLLFFLLLGYRSQSVMLEGADGIRLPPSESDKALVVSLPLTVTPKAITLLDSHVMFLDEGSVPPRDLEGSKIVPLFKRLTYLLESGRMDKAKTFVLLLADRQLQTDLITKVMKTCGMAGLPNFHFGVARP